MSSFSNKSKSQKVSQLDPFFFLSQCKSYPLSTNYSFINLQNYMYIYTQPPFTMLYLFICEMCVPQFPVSPKGHVMSLREQQVVRLQKEINHTAGVRLTLRRKDCVNSIAFVNCFSQVRSKIMQYILI